MNIHSKKSFPYLEGDSNLKVSHRLHSELMPPDIAKEEHWNVAGVKHSFREFRILLMKQLRGDWQDGSRGSSSLAFKHC